MFDLELDKVISEINNRSAKNVMIQLPDGLKKNANEIVMQIENETQASVFIWFSSCFGACDLPIGLDILGIDFMVQFGHNRYVKDLEKW